ncbi:MAG TPA: hypothetical protein VI278_18740 [Nitrososphaeraceae archaeon]
MAELAKFSLSYFEICHKQAQAIAEQQKIAGQRIPIRGRWYPVYGPGPEGEI